MSPLAKQPELVLGVVLAGGHSRRMGTDKALLELDGVSLGERAARRLGAICSRVVVADSGRDTVARVPSIVDGFGEGPIAGILGAAAAYPDTTLLILACDLPRVPISLLGELATRTAFDWSVPRWEGRLEPLCALYGPRALTALHDQASLGVLAPHRLAQRTELEIDFLDDEKLLQHGDPATLFTNLNQPQDVALLKGNRSADAD